MIFPGVSNSQWIDDLIDIALAEDIGSGDVTTNAIVEKGRKASAVWTAKQEGVVAGLGIAKFAFQKLDTELQWNSLVEEGQPVKNGELLAEMKGECRAVLTAERTALNIVQRMSGIATKTNQLMRMLDGFSTKILDTRKTAPGLRRLDKMAVKSAGGSNHRAGLYDMVMIKDNHILAAGGILEAVEQVRSQYSDIRIEVETTSIEQVDQALKAGADIIMLDNMDPDQMREAVEKIGELAETEASGNITESDIREVAATGVNFISVGALTHSVRAFDISQRITEIF